MSLCACASVLSLPAAVAWRVRMMCSVSVRQPVPPAAGAGPGWEYVRIYYISLPVVSAVSAQNLSNPALRSLSETPAFKTFRSFKMSSVDSEATFEVRVQELELSQHLPRLREQGWTTFGKFAFSSDYIPGAGDTAVFTRDVVVPTLGREDHPDKYPLRRLFFDAYTLVVNEFRRRLERGSGDAPAPVADAEREKRRKRVQDRLAGLLVEGELEPSHFLQDAAFAIYDTGNIRYIPWEHCSKRESELQGTKTVRQWRPDAHGAIREVSEAEPTRADLRSDLLLSYALRRRGLAMEMADLCAYETHERLVELLLGELLRVPHEGYRKCSLEQLHRADAAIFQYLASHCRGSTKRGPDGTRPFDKHLPLALLDPHVRQHLAPLMAAPGSKAGGGAPASSAGGGGKRANDSSLAAENKRLKAELAQVKASMGNAGGSQAPRGKGKGRGKKGAGTYSDTYRPKMPPGLVGKAYRTSGGDPICFSFNLGGCSGASAGGRCPKGYHVCAEPGCGQAHPMSQHAS